MTKPIGVLKSALKDNSNKKYREHAAWMEAKKTNRPYQMFDEATGKWRKIMEPRKVTE